MHDLARALTPPAFDVAVPCGDDVHWISVRGDTLRTLSHPEEELALVALGGDLSPCMLAVRLVEQAPAQLAAADDLLSRHRGHVDALTLPSVNAVARSAGEAPVDVLSIPQPLRRIAALRFLRRQALSHSRPKGYLTNHIRIAIKYVGRKYLDEVKVSVGEENAYSRDRKHGLTVSVTPDWLSTVYLWDVAIWQDRLVLAAELDGNALRLTTLERRPLEMEVVRASVPDDIRVPAEARA